MAWNKFRFYYSSLPGRAGSTLTADSTASGDYSVNYLYNMLETNMWKSNATTNPQYITLDLGVTNSLLIDYYAIIGHNLFTIGATVTLQYSSNGTTWYDAYYVTPASDAVILAEFNAVFGYRYWRMKISKTSGSFSAAPYMTLCIWGDKTELDYATASFDPHEQTVKANVGLSQGGYVTGIHTQYAERSMALRIEDADATLYAKVKAWWDTSGLKNFFVAWETANNPNEVWLMRPDMKFSNPLKNGGAYRDIVIGLKGRKE